MSEKTFFVFTKSEPGKPVKIKADSFILVSDNRINFESGGERIAVFNMSELVGFVRSDHVVNG